MAKCADDFGMPFVAHKDDMTAGINLPFGLLVDFRNQRTCGVKIGKAALLCIGGYRFGYAMRRKYYMAAIGHFVEFFDKYRAFGFQAVDHIAVMDNFMADIDRRAMLFERKLDNLDGAVDARAKTTWSGQSSRSDFLGRDCSVMCNVL